MESIQIPVEDGSKITLNLYYPQGYDANSSPPLPCYFNVHGGGWVIGDLGDDDSFLRTVCNECNAVIVDVGYRLSPEYKFPIPVTDCWDAYRWVAQNASRIGIDKNRIAVGGFSAGGHISAIISQLARDQKFEAKPCFQLLVIPVCDASALDTSLNVRKGESRCSSSGLRRSRLTVLEFRYSLCKLDRALPCTFPFVCPHECQSSIYQ